MKRFERTEKETFKLTDWKLKLWVAIFKGFKGSRSTDFDAQTFETRNRKFAHPKRIVESRAKCHRACIINTVYDYDSAFPNNREAIRSCNVDSTAQLPGAFDDSDRSLDSLHTQNAFRLDFRFGLCKPAQRLCYIVAKTPKVSNGSDGEAFQKPCFRRLRILEFLTDYVDCLQETNC